MTAASIIQKEIKYNPEETLDYPLNAESPSIVWTKSNTTNGKQGDSTTG